MTTKQTDGGEMTSSPLRVAGQWQEMAVSLQGRLEKAEAETERLRGALEEIAEDPHQLYTGGESGQYDIGVADGHRCAAMKAERALAVEGEQNG